MKTPVPSLHPTRAMISLAAMRHNLNVVRSYVGPHVKIMAVVKANAYGHGIRTIAYEAVRYGAAYLAVARIDEAAELRREGIESPVLVFEMPFASQIERAILDEIDLTVCSLESAEQINSVAEALNRRAKIHVKIDTGMGRLGFAYQNAAASIERVAHMSALDVIGIYSHFASSDETDLTYSRVQLERFKTVLAHLQTKRIEVPLKHFANSGAIISLPESHFTMVRPGIMLYGYAPRRSMTTHPGLRPVMSLISKISFIKTVDAHTSVSYNRRYFAEQKTRIATVPVGYGDGYSRLLTQKTSVLIKKQRFPVVGTICMDHIMVDVGTEASLAVGDDVVLIGTDGSESIDGWEVAEKLGTIPYEVTCNISQRVQRAFTA